MCVGSEPASGWYPRCVAWPLLLSFRCLVKGCASDVVLLSPHDVPNPSPSPSHDDGLHAVSIAAGKLPLARDGVRPKDSQDSPGVLCVEDLQPGDFSLCRLSAFRAIS